MMATAIMSAREFSFRKATTVAGCSTGSGLAQTNRD